MSENKPVATLNGIHGNPRIKFHRRPDGSLWVEIVQSGAFSVNPKDLIDVCHSLMSQLIEGANFYCACRSCSGSDEPHEFKCECPK